MNSILQRRIKQNLEKINQASETRSREILKEINGVHISCANKKMLNFSGNDYLGLAQEPTVQEALLMGLKKYNLGTCASQMVCGYTETQHQLEIKLAEFLDFERVLLVSSGFLANIGVLQALLQKEDMIFIDRCSHASLYDGIKLAQCTMHRFRHKQIDHLMQLLQKESAKNSGCQWIVSDGLFSMEGTIASLPKLVTMAKQFNTCLLIDDAHGIGVLGPVGRGCIDLLAVNAQHLTVLTGTLSKAFGCFGAFIAGSSDVIEYLIQVMRTARYTSNLSPPFYAAGLNALHCIQSQPWRRIHLTKLIDYFKAGAKALRLPLQPSDTPIQILNVADANLLMHIHECLRDRGLWVGAMRPPTVAPGGSRLRLTFSALHQQSDVDHLLAGLDKVIPSELRLGM